MLAEPLPEDTLVREIQCLLYIGNSAADSASDLRPCATVTSHSRPQPSRGPLAARTGRRPRSSGESEWTSGDEESPNAPPEGTGHLTGAETARQAAIIAAAVAGATFVAGEAFYRATVGRFWRPWPSQDRVDRWRGRFGGTPQLNTQVPLHQLNSGFNQGPTANQVGRHSSV